MMEQIPKPDAGSFPFRSAILAYLSVQSAISLTGQDELAGVVTHFADPELQTNYIGTIIDTLFLSYGANILLSQAGIIKESPTASKVSLNDMECQVRLSVGREPGTWMPQDWAASGARLSLPVRMRFSDEVVDMGFPGEESLNPGGSRYAKKLYCEGGSFVGAQGEVVVKATGGAWSAESSDIPGASTVNWFVDFPEAAARNDVTLPSGRVFFSGAAWESKEALPDGILDGAIEMPSGSGLDGQAAGVVEGPGSVFLLNQGGLSVKRNSWKNAWGAFGDVMFILGRYSVATSSASADTSAGTTSAELSADTPDSLRQERLELERKLREVDEALRKTEDA